MHSVSAQLDATEARQSFGTLPKLLVQRWAAAGIFAVLAAFVLAKPHVSLFLRSADGLAFQYFVDNQIYNRTVLANNYFTDGFIRRGLGGTIATLLSPDWGWSTLLFSIVSAFALIIPVALIIRTITPKLDQLYVVYFSAILALSPQTFDGWALDIARTDLMIGGCLAATVLAWMRGQRIGAALFILIGLLIHETAVIFGLPLLAAMAWLDWRAGKADLKSLSMLAALVCVSIGSIQFLQYHFSIPSEVIARNMLEQAPALEDRPDLRDMRDVAIYMAAAGGSALSTAICFNLDYNQQYWPLFPVPLILLACYAIILPMRPRWLTCGIVMLVPTLFMLLIANDTGRWVKLSVLNGWLITAYCLAQGSWRRPSNTQWILGASVMVILALMGTTRVNAPNPASQALVKWMGFDAPVSLYDWMSKCDPQWERQVYGPNFRPDRPLHARADRGGWNQPDHAPTPR